MNNFVILKRIQRYKKVTYYSVCLNGETDSLFEKFIEINQSKNFEKLNHLLAWLELIGTKYAAQPQYFRNEAFRGSAKALPPGGKTKSPKYTVDGITQSNDLRLYCHVLNEHVVILFGGNIKTTLKAQDCPNVKTDFLLANQLTNVIDKAIIENELTWNKRFTDLTNTNELLISI